METVAGMTDLQIKLFTAIGQIAVACIVGYVAWQQWRTAKKKLKADIFDKRFASYRSLVDAVQALLDDETLADDPRPALKRIEAIRRTSIEMKWLFSSSVAGTAGRITEHCRDFLYSSVDARESESQNERVKALKRVVTADAQLAAELENLQDALGHYLKLDH